MVADVVLVHGGWGTPDDWDLVVDHLTSAGVRGHTVDLPSTRTADAGLDDDVAEVEEMLERYGDDSVLVGHSYSGMVVTAASAGRRLRGLVYVAAFVPNGEDTVYSLLSSAPSSTLSSARGESPIQIHDNGTATLEPWPPVDAVTRFGAAATDAMAKRPRRAQSLGVAIAPAPAFGWREHEATYILTARDQVIPPELQRTMASRASEIVEIDSDHFPNFEAPEALAELLARIARG